MDCRCTHAALMSAGTIGVRSVDMYCPSPARSFELMLLRDYRFNVHLRPSPGTATRQAVSQETRSFRKSADDVSGFPLPEERTSAFRLGLLMNFGHFGRLDHCPRTTYRKYWVHGSYGN